MGPNAEPDRCPFTSGRRADKLMKGGNNGASGSYGAKKKMVSGRRPSLENKAACEQRSLIPVEVI